MPRTNSFKFQPSKRFSRTIQGNLTTNIVSNMTPNDEIDAMGISWSQKDTVGDCGSFLAYTMNREKPQEGHSSSTVTLVEIEAEGSSVNAPLVSCSLDSTF